MKPRTLLAIAIALPTLSAVATPGEALADGKPSISLKGPAAPKVDPKAQKSASTDKAGSTDAKKTAAPDPSKSPASDDIALTQGSVSYLEKKMADATDLATDKSKLSGFKTALDSVKGGLKRIKAADPKWDVTAWEKIVQQADARLQKAEQTVAAKDSADKANESTYRDYVWKLSSVQDGMGLLAQLETKPEEMKIYSKNQIFGNMAKFIAAVEALDKGCKEKGWDKLTVIPPSYVKDLPAAQGCKRAAKWKELGKKFVELQAKGGTKEEVARLQGVIEKAKTGEPISAADHERLNHPAEYITTFKADYDKGGEAFGLVTETSWYEPLKTTAATYPAALAEAAKTSRWDKKATYADQGTSLAITKQHQKGGIMNEGQLVKAASFTEWFVDKNILGTPVSRSRSVEVLVKIKDETYCRLYSRTAGSSFQSGAWQPTGVSGGESSFRISACK